MLPPCDAWNALFLGFGPQASVPVGVYVATLRCLGCILPWVWATGLGACRCICCHLAMPGMRNWKITKNACKLFPLPCCGQGRKKVPRTFLQLDLGRAVTRRDEAMRRLFFNGTVDGTKKRRPRQSLARARGRVRDDPVRGTALTTMLKTNPGGSRGAARPSPAAPPLTLLKF